MLRTPFAIALSAVLAIAQSSRAQQSAVSPEADFTSICSRLPSEGDWSARNLVSDANLGLSSDATQVRVRSLEGLKCVRQLLRFLSFRSYQAADGGIRDRRFGARILWNAVEVAEAAPAASEMRRAVLDMLDEQRYGFPPEPRSASQYYNSARLALTLFRWPDPDRFWDEPEARASRYRAHFLDVTGLELADVVADPGRYTAWLERSVENPTTDDEWRSARPHPMEMERIEWLLGRFFERALQPSATAAFFNVVRLPAEFAQVDRRHLQRLAVLGRLSRFPEGVARRAFLGLVKEDKPVLLRDLPEQRASWQEQASFDIDGSYTVGRCGEFPVKARGITSVSGDNSGQGCGWSPGTNGYGNLNVDLIETGLTPFAAGRTYTASITSWLRGGHRGRSFGVSAEDQTGRVQYVVSGRATIPQCENVSTCNSVVQLLALNLSSPADEDTIQSEILYKPFGAAAFVQVVPRQPVLVDRSRGSIELSFRLARAYTHVGACCEKGWVTHKIFLYAFADVPAFTGSERMTAGSLDRARRLLASAPEVARGSISAGPRGAASVGGLGWHSAGQVLALRSDQTSARFEDRFQQLYPRLLAAHFAATAPGIGPHDRTSLELARVALSNAARQAYFEPGRQVYRTVAGMVADLRPAELAEQVSVAINDLIATSGRDVVDSLRFLDDLERRVSGSASGEAVGEAVRAVREAAAENERRRTILRLMELRGQLRVAAKAWRERLVDLATELSLFEPAFARDPGLI